MDWLWYLNLLWHGTELPVRLSSPSCFYLSLQSGRLANGPVNQGILGSYRNQINHLKKSNQINVKWMNYQSLSKIVKLYLTPKIFIAWEIICNILNCIWKRQRICANNAGCVCDKLFVFIVFGIKVSGICPRLSVVQKLNLVITKSCVSTTVFIGYLSYQVKLCWCFLGYYHHLSILVQINCYTARQLRRIQF